MNKTYMMKESETQHAWHVVDVSGKVLGRVASMIARKLMGKQKPTYTPHMDSGDFVVVINAEQIVTTGTKEQNKEYFRYSGYQSGLSKKTLSQVRIQQPERVIREAVYKMLPDNRLRDDRMNRLKIYVGGEHPHQSQIA